MFGTGSGNGEPTTRAARCIPDSVLDAAAEKRIRNMGGTFVVPWEKILTTKQKACRPDSPDRYNHSFKSHLDQCLCGRFNRGPADMARCFDNDVPVVVNTDVPDMVNHPPHYNGHPKQIECIDVVEEASDYNLGQVIKYVWRVLFGHKEDSIQDLEKAKWYLDRAIDRRHFAAQDKQKIETRALEEGRT